MTPLSDGERRAVAILAALLLLASAARWIDRPRSILGDVPDVDLTALAEASRDAKETKAGSRSRGTNGRTGMDTGLGTRAGKGAAAAAPGRVTVRIDPNRASADELDRLPGIGPAVAARIVAARDSAPFATVDDLQRVRGIGPALAARLAEHVTLPPGPAPQPQGATPPRSPDGRPPPRTTPPPSPGGPPPPREPIDLNRATAEQLQAISGVGPALAARLIARRDSIRGFRSYADVDAVRGIGPAVLEKIRASTVIR